MFADENRFVALDLQHRKLVDNADGNRQGVCDRSGSHGRKA